MVIKNQRGNLLDQLIEFVGIKSGLVLRRDDAIRLLEQEGDREPRWPDPWWRGDPTDLVRVRAEILEADYTHVLFMVGTLPDSRSWSDIVDDGTMPPLPPEELLMEEQRRFVLNRDLPETRTWDGVIPLSDLFESEVVPEGATGFFDQRYIDYLSAQAEDLKAIHWRQFEHLTAEFFARNGYDVEITPPRGDGGLDVIARRQGGIAGPEVIIVQCKRYAPTNTVKIEEVKAFWATVDDIRATRGVVATTSQLEHGARAYITARQYRLSAAEVDQVTEWLRVLASPDAQRDPLPASLLVRPRSNPADPAQT